MKKEYKRWILLLLWICWMGVIFVFSAKTAPESTVQSNRVGKLLCSVFVEGYGSMPSEEQLKMAENIDFFVRKTAHFLEYSLLGVLTLLAVKAWFRIKGPFRSRYLWGALFWCIIYAISDELHQYFVPGRACKVQDMILDSFGAAFGILLVLLFCRLIKKTGKDPA